MAVDSAVSAGAASSPGSAGTTGGGSISDIDPFSSCWFKRSNSDGAPASESVGDSEAAGVGAAASSAGFATFQELGAASSAGFATFQDEPGAAPGADPVAGSLPGFAAFHDELAGVPHDILGDGADVSDDSGVHAGA